MVNQYLLGKLSVALYIVKRFRDGVNCVCIGGLLRNVELCLVVRTPFNRRSKTTYVIGQTNEQMVCDWANFRCLGPRHCHVLGQLGLCWKDVHFVRFPHSLLALRTFTGERVHRSSV